MRYIRRRFLLFFMFSVLLGSAYTLFVKEIFSPTDMKRIERREMPAATLARVYENFLHKTKYSYETILASGTNYNNQERVFVELTKKMKGLDPRNTDYSKLQQTMTNEIKNNEAAFRSFFQKVTKYSPEEINKLVEERHKEFDIILEGK